MIVIAACFPIETRKVRPTGGLRIVRVPMGARASEGLAARMSGDALQLLISAGFSGGLARGARTGDLVLAESIEHNGEKLVIDAGLLKRAEKALRAEGQRPKTGPMLCTTSVIESPREKTRLGESGAIAVDMESGPLCRWAGEHDVPFLSVRVILDPVEMRVLFPSERPMWRSAIAHPLATIRVGVAARHAARALGPALNGVAAALEEDT